MGTRWSHVVVVKSVMLLLENLLSLLFPLRKKTSSFLEGVWREGKEEDRAEGRVDQLAEGYVQTCIRMKVLEHFSFLRFYVMMSV